MALAFVAGVMNLTWMIGVTLFIVFDHAILRTPVLSRVSGAFFLIAGMWFLI
jgi:predicted metal-binding membrane protein